MKNIKFLGQFFKKENNVGAIIPSSKFLAKKIMKPMDFENANVIIELGGGTGIITKELLSNMREDAKLYVFETNESFCKQLRKINDKRLSLIEDSAEKIHDYLNQDNISECKYIISSLPFTILPSSVKKDIING
ncbi:MAG: class I SAM-dependent methyltransferase, partial [Flavobacteriales bacterium]